MNRDCTDRIPVYPMYPGMPMNMGMPMGMPGNTTFTTYENINDNGIDLSKLNTQIQNLERRVNRLESIVGNNTPYQDSNYHIM